MSEYTLNLKPLCCRITSSGVNGTTKTMEVSARDDSFIVEMKEDNIWSRVSGPVDVTTYPEVIQLRTRHPK